MKRWNRIGHIFVIPIKSACGASTWHRSSGPFWDSVRSCSYSQTNCWSRTESIFTRVTVYKLVQKFCSEHPYCCSSQFSHDVKQYRNKFQAQTTNKRRKRSGYCGKLGIRKLLRILSLWRWNLLTPFPQLLRVTRTSSAIENPPPHNSNYFRNKFYRAPNNLDTAMQGLSNRVFIENCCLFGAYHSLEIRREKRFFDSFEASTKWSAVCEKRPKYTTTHLRALLYTEEKVRQ